MISKEIITCIEQISPWILITSNAQIPSLGLIWVFCPHIQYQLRTILTCLFCKFFRCSIYTPSANPSLPASSALHVLGNKKWLNAKRPPGKHLPGRPLIIRMVVKVFWFKTANALGLPLIKEFLAAKSQQAEQAGAEQEPGSGFGAYWLDQVGQVVANELRFSATAAI